MRIESNVFRARTDGFPVSARKPQMLSEQGEIVRECGWSLPRIRALGEERLQIVGANEGAAPNLDRFEATRLKQGINRRATKADRGDHFVDRKQDLGGH